MKEVALAGSTSHVFSVILTHLLENGLVVSAMVDNPEKIMLANERLFIRHLDAFSESKCEEAFQGFHDVILAYDDNLRNSAHNDWTLKTFIPTLTGARKAGANRLIVIGSPDSEAFFVTELERLSDIDWVFISTEGDFGSRVVSEITTPKFHREAYAE